MNDIFEKLFATPITKATAGTYQPAIVFGLGGTGTRVIRQLKRRMPIDQDSNIRFFAVDSDTTENALSEAEDMPQLKERDELWILDAPTAVNVLQAATADNPACDHVKEWLPKKSPDDGRNLHNLVEAKIARNKGAGQFRRAGKMLLTANVSAGIALRNRIQTMRAEMLGLSALIMAAHQGMRIQAGVQIFVVTSLSGGTGAGCLLDFLALIRSIFPGTAHTVNLVGVLPGSALDDEIGDDAKQKANTRGNAMGLLGELQAIKQDNLTPLDFRFDGTFKTTVASGVTYADNIFLVDNQQFNGTPATVYLDICNAIAMFLYQFLGNGVGAKIESVNVNLMGLGNPAGGAPASGGGPRIYHAFGVSYLEFPARDLRQFAYCAKLIEWIDRLHASSGSGAKTTATEWALHLGLGDAAAIAATVGIKDVHTQIPRATQDLWLGSFDNAFESGTKTWLSMFEGRANDLAGETSESFPTQQATLLKEFRETVLKTAATLPGGTVNALKAFKAHLVDLKKSLSVELAPGAKNSVGSSLAKQQADLLKVIHRRDILSDKPQRNEYIRTLQKQAKALLVTATGVVQLRYLSAVEAECEQALKQTDDFVRDLGTLRGMAQNRLKVLAGQTYRPSFGVQLLQPKEYAETAALMTNDLKDPLGLAIGGITLSGIVESTWSIWSPAIDAQLNMSSVTDLVRQKVAAKRKAAFLAKGSEELIRFETGSVVAGQVRRSAHVTGKFGTGASGNEFIDTYLPSLGEGLANVHCTPIDDPHCLVCVRLLSSFGIQSWAGFKECYEHYTAGSTFDFGTLPLSVIVPPLRDLSQNESMAQTAFGLAWMMDLIRTSGSNYYLNYKAVDEKVHGAALGYLTFSKDRPLAARALLENKLLAEADTSETKVSQHAILLGKSLEAAIETLQTPKHANSINEIILAFNELGDLIGKNVTKQFVDSWIASDLAAIRKVANAARGELLKSIAEEMKRYASQP